MVVSIAVSCCTSLFVSCLLLSRIILSSLTVRPKRLGLSGRDTLSLYPFDRKCLAVRVNPSHTVAASFSPLLNSGLRTQAGVRHHCCNIVGVAVGGHTESTLGLTMLEASQNMNVLRREKTGCDAVHKVAIK